MPQTSTATTSDGSSALSERVVEAVAETDGVSELELPPLYDVVDPDALEALFQPGATGTIRFTYHGYEVLVTGDGEVSVCALY